MSRPAPKRSRPDLWLTAAIVLLPGLGVAAWATARLQVADLAERLVMDATALEGETAARPSHALSSLPGSFADRCGSALDELRPSWKEAQALPQEDGVFLGAVLAGDADLDFLPDSWWLLFLGNRDRFARVRLATHAENGTLPGGLQALPTPDAPLREDGWSLLRYAADAGLLELRVALASGDPEGALEHCLDVLALGRDAAVLQPLLGRMIGAAIVARALPGCAAALDAAPASAKRAALGRLAGIRDAAPDWPAVLRVERVQMQLVSFARVIPPGARARLPPRARALVAHEAQADQGSLADLGVKLLERDYWSTYLEQLATLEELLQLEGPAEREAAIRRYEKRRDRELNPLASREGGSWVEYDRRHRVTQLRLDALLLLAAAELQRAEEGSWPGSIQEAEDWLRREGVLRDPQAEGELLLLAEGDGASLVLPVPRFVGEEGNTTLRMHPDGPARLTTP